MRSMQLANQVPSVCSVLEGKKFQQMASLELVERQGPKSSTTTTYLYKQLRPVASAPVDEGAPPTETAMRQSTVPPPVNLCQATARLCLVSCVAKKRPHPAPAKDLYTSPWFLKARGFVEAKGWPWFILSAKYGLVDPQEEIAPYDETLNTMSKAERCRWAREVLNALEPHLSGVCSVVFLAGAKYREFLEPALANREIDVLVPMRRLPIGKQLAWLSRARCRCGCEDCTSSAGDLAQLGHPVRTPPPSDQTAASRCCCSAPASKPVSTPPPSDRTAATACFYDLLQKLQDRLGGCLRLAECDGHMGWPQRGVYFFFEPGESRGLSGVGDRVVRIGTHALTDGSRSTLWQRLSHHRGNANNSGGNHRGSIFRLLVGTALARRGDCPLPRSWGVGADPGKAARKLQLGSGAAVQDAEADLERRVSAYIGQMPFLWLNVPDAPSAESARGCIERNAIALLSHARAPAADPPSANWLGMHSDRSRVRASGLWNNNHVEEVCDEAFLRCMAALIAAA